MTLKLIMLGIPKLLKRVEFHTLSSCSTVCHALLAAFILNSVVLAIGVPLPVMSRLAIKSAALFDGAQAKMKLSRRWL